MARGRFSSLIVGAPAAVLAAMTLAAQVAALTAAEAGQAPDFAPVNFPTLPPHFCSQVEASNFLIEVVNLQNLRAAENAETAARHRAELERAINDHVQAGRPVPAGLQSQRRNAEVKYAEHLGISDRMAQLRSSALKIPVIACPGQQDSKAIAASDRLPSSREGREMLDFHNRLRAEVGLPSLRWNPRLEAGAGEWAQKLTEIGVMQHSPRAGREDQRENIVLSRSGTNSLPRMLQTWSDERNYFRPGVFPEVCTDGWQSCAHYTMIISPRVTDVGCSIQLGRQFDALVCRYSPPGNRDGDLVGLPPTIIAQAPTININQPAPAAPPPPAAPQQVLPVDQNNRRVADTDDLRQLLADAAAKSGLAPESSIDDIPLDAQGRIPSNPEDEITPWEIRQLDRLAASVARPAESILDQIEYLPFAQLTDNCGNALSAYQLPALEPLNLFPALERLDLRTGKEFAFDRLVNNYREISPGSGMLEWVNPIWFFVYEYEPMSKGLRPNYWVGVTGRVYDQTGPAPSVLRGRCKWRF